jgi:archaellum biogenesis ATPase FlaH
MNFDTEKQKLLLEYLISSPDIFALCRGIVKPEYFDIDLRNTVKFIFDFYDKYSDIPDPLIVKAETKVTLNVHKGLNTQLQYCMQEVELFCQFSAMKRAILRSAELINDGEFGGVSDLVRDALLVSLNKDLGLRYFEDPESRLEKMLLSPPVVPTGWDDVDEALYGGIGRKELLLFAAPSGGGKSLALANLGLNLMKRKKNVLYVSFELSPEIIAQRFDTMLTGVSRKVWKENVEVILDTLHVERESHGDLFIIQMPSGTKSHQVNAYLKEFYLHYKQAPDILLLDYLDLMAPNSGTSDGVWEKDKAVSEESRNLGVEWNIPVASASQLNRSSVGQEIHNHAMIAGGISKINTCDNLITILFDETRRRKGEIQFQFGKTRNSDAVGSMLDLDWIDMHLRIQSKGSGRLALKPKAKPIPEKKKGIIDMMNI